MIALVVVAVVAAVASGFAVLFYWDLASISPCYGGLDLGPGGPSCAVLPFELQQLGQSRSANGTYSADVLITPATNTDLVASSLRITLWNDSGSNVPLRSVVLSTTSGLTLANYAVSGWNWTTSQSIETPWTSILILTSSRVLAGQYVTVADTAQTAWGPFPCPLD